MVYRPALPSMRSRVSVLSLDSSRYSSHETTLSSISPTLPLSVNMVPSSLAIPQGAVERSSTVPVGKDTERYICQSLPLISRANDTSFVSPSNTYAPAPVPNVADTVPSERTVMLTTSPEKKLSHIPLNVPCANGVSGASSTASGISAIGSPSPVGVMKMRATRGLGAGEYSPSARSFSGMLSSLIAKLLVPPAASAP